MALNAAAVWEIRTTGSDDNGGAFRTGASGTDFSQQDAAQATLTAASVVHSTTTQINVAVGDYTVTNNDVGNHLNITGGTATAGVYEITTVDIPNNRWTVDRSVGTAGQTVVGAMGGAMASVGRANSFAVASNKLWIKAGTYTITSSSFNVAGGCVSSTNGKGYEGYQTTRGDLGTPPLLQADGVITGFTVFSLSTASHAVINISVDCNNRATSTAFNLSVTYTYKCKVVNSTANAFAMSSNSITIECEASGCSGTAVFGLAASQAHAILCYSHDNTIPGFNITSAGAMCIHCISESNSGASSDGFTLNGATCGVFNCSAYNNGRDGFRILTNVIQVVNCIAEDNAGWGFNVNGPSNDVFILGCAGFSNASGEVQENTGLFVQNIGFVTGSGSFFTNAAAGDFSLNDTAGAGAAAKSAGYPGVYPGGLTTGFEDIGAAQSQGNGGGGGSSAVLRRQSVIPYVTHTRG